MMMTFGFHRDDGMFVPVSGDNISTLEILFDVDVELYKMSESFFVSNYDKLTLGVRFGLPISSMPEHELNKILQLSGIDFALACKLLDTKKRHAVLTTCKKNLRNWLRSNDDHVDTLPPWSHRQSLVLEKILMDNYVSELRSIRKSFSIVSVFT